MRRKDREMSKEFALGVVDKCEWATAAMIDTEGAPYAVTLSIVRMGDGIYFHSAMSGYKTECLRRDPRVCVTCVGHTRRATDAFTTYYESAVVRGRASEVTDEREKIAALKALCERHTPANMADFDNALRRSLARTAVWRISIEGITGKAKLDLPKA